MMQKTTQELNGMKRSTAIIFALVLSLIGALSLSTAKTAFAQVYSPDKQFVTPVGPDMSPEATQEPDSAVHGWYFYGNDCPHCLKVLEEDISPLVQEYGESLDIRLLEISIPEYYEALMLVESHFDVPALKRSIPTLVLGDQIFIGETEIRDNLLTVIEEGLNRGGLPFPEIEGIDPTTLITVEPNPDSEDDPFCDSDEESCVVEAPIYIAYFYQTGCKECSRVEADLNYLRTKYPQIQIQDFNIYDHADLANWMAERIDPDGTFQSPAVFIGDRALMGEEILPENIIPILEEYRVPGAPAVWEDFDPEEAQESIIARFKNMGWLTVVAAGLVDGINPCAFATLIFFVSYLTISGRSGKQVLWVGGAFTFGVFLAYLIVGLGLYKVLELVGSTLDMIARVVYILTAIFCLVLAVLSFLDYRKAKKGEIGDMMLKLPEPMRKRINATIRQGRKSRNYIFGAFGAGILISFLELACTGQVYLPTIIFVSSIPELRLQAFFYLLLYNLLFILPLVVIFVLVYFGTTSKDLTRFLQEKAAAVKFAMSIVFVLLGGWLIFSLVL
jgi:cytochrome c biogenesis protein CcdA/glutaredoxin